MTQFNEQVRTYSEYTRRVRRSLLISTSILFALHFVEISGEFNWSGLNVSIHPRLLLVMLSLVTVYLLFSFQVLTRYERLAWMIKPDWYHTILMIYLPWGFAVFAFFSHATVVLAELAFGGFPEVQLLLEAVAGVD